MSVSIATMGMYGTVGTAGSGTGETVYLGGVGGAGGGVERKKPVVVVSRISDSRKEKTIVRVTLLDEE